MTAVDLDNIRLSYGSHKSREEGMCLMEAVAYVAGEPHTDRPQCVCPVLAAFGRAWNDALDDEARNRLLKPFIPRLIGTRSTVEVEYRRTFMATDWAVRVAAPVWLRAAGLDDEAASLEALHPLTSAGGCLSAASMIAQVRDAARAAWDAAGAAAAGDAAGAVAVDATWAAGVEATRDAGVYSAWAAAGAGAGYAAVYAAVYAAGAAARDAAVYAAGAAARDAAVYAAGAAARDAAVSAAGDADGVAAVLVARAVARTAARDVLRPHVERLQASAVDLYEQMIEIGDAP